MARIRTIKPEFPQSESMGRVSREARLCFILLWTLADDSGRLRGNSRMLASLLYPYDDDAPKLIDEWLNELQAEGCVQRYCAGGDRYLAVAAWTKHQKIDKPSASKLPSPESEFVEVSRVLAKARESSSEDQGRDQGKEGIISSPIGDVSAELRSTPSESPTPADASKTSPARPTPSGIDDCPHQAIIAAFHAALPMAREVRTWTPARAALLRARWREKPKRQSVDWWEKFFGFCAHSAFLTGRSTGSGDRRPFDLGLEWLVKAENFAKVIEGKYHEPEEAEAANSAQEAE